MMTKQEERAYRRLRNAIEQNAFFEDWWPGIDDVIYENEEAKETVKYFRAALLDYAKFPKNKAMRKK